MQITFSEPNAYDRFDVTIEGVITLKGCKYMKSEKWDFIAMPQYLKRNKEGEAQKNAKTGKDMYVRDYVVDKAMEAQILAAYKENNGGKVIDDSDIPF